MFDSLNHLVVPIRIVGEGAYGTVYQAKRYNIMVSQRVAELISGEGPLKGGNTQQTVTENTGPASGQRAFTSTLPPVAPTQRKPSDPSPMQPPILVTPDMPPYSLVAVKEVSFELIPDAIDDVLREVSFMHGMRHENVVRYISSFLHDGTYGGITSNQHLNLKSSGQSPRSPSPRGTEGKGTLLAPCELESLAETAVLQLYPDSSVLSSPHGTINSANKQRLPSNQTESFSPLPSMCAVEEYIEGISLSELIRLRTTNFPFPDSSGAGGVAQPSSASATDNATIAGPLSPTELAIILRDILKALHYLHTDARIVHRDIKCANIVLDERNQCAKVLDFGTCGAIDSPKVTRHTVLGTPGWIAPEVLEGGVITNSGGTGTALGHGFRSDLWSFGVTVLELAFLRQSTATQADPFFAKAIKYLSQIQCSVSVHDTGVTGSGEVIFTIPPVTGASPFNLSAEEKLFTPLLRDLVACCLRRNPSQRPSAGDLLRHPFFLENLPKDDLLAEHTDKTNSGSATIAALMAATRALQKRLGTDNSNIEGNSATTPATNSTASRRRPLLDHQLTQSDSPRQATINTPHHHFDRGSATPTSATTSVIRFPYQMQYLNLFTNTYSEAACLAHLNEKSAASSLEVLKNVLVPAARAAPQMAMEIHRKFKTVVALKSGVPLDTPLPAQPSSSAASSSQPSVGTQSLASNPPAVTGIVLAPDTQQHMQRLALGYHAEDPERQRRSAALMEQHVEILYALEKKLPGFAEKFTAKFLDSLMSEHPDGNDVLANAVSMLTRLKADVIKPDVILADPTSNTIEATSDTWKESSAPAIYKMPSPPQPKTTVVTPSLGATTATKNNASTIHRPQQPPATQQFIDPTSYLFNQMVDTYAQSGAAGGVGGMAGQQHQSRLGGM